jgi:hypothetical protein
MRAETPRRGLLWAGRTGAQDKRQAVSRGYSRASVTGWEEGWTGVPLQCPSTPGCQESGRRKRVSTSLFLLGKKLSPGAHTTLKDIRVA